MPDVKRRSFLQIIGAGSLLPFLPGASFGGTAAAGGASTSKALWASLYANSGSSARFVGQARALGLSNAAISGIGARSIGVRLALSSTVSNVAKTAGRKLAPKPMKLARALSADHGLESKLDLRRAIGNYFVDEPDNPSNLEERTDDEGEHTQSLDAVQNEDRADVDLKPEAIVSIES